MLFNEYPQSIETPPPHKRKLKASKKISNVTVLDYLTQVLPLKGALRGLGVLSR